MRGKLVIAIGLVAAGLLLAGCRGGTYSIDIFQEMHYQEGYSSYEPPRLSPPDEAVPITGRDVPFTLSFQDVTALRNPVPLTPGVLQRAEKLYQVNCAMCHGVNADGDSPVADRFELNGATRPVAYNSERVRGRTEGQLFWAMSNPRGFGFMPSFAKLLTDEERWALVHYVRAKASGQ